MKRGIDFTGISVVTMCHDGEGRYLIEQRSEKCRDEQHTWSPVGSGALHAGETLVEAVRREVMEECGANALDIEFMGHREVFREVNGEVSHWIAFDFKARVDPREVSIQEPEMCIEHRWCTVEEIPEPRHSQFPVFLRQHKHLL